MHYIEKGSLGNAMAAHDAIARDAWQGKGMEGTKRQGEAG